MSKVMKRKKSKQIVSVLLCFALLLSYLQTVVLADTSTVSYLWCDENGTNWTEKTQECTTVTNIMTTLGAADTETWYAVKSDVTLNSRVNILGNVNLILCDNTTYDSSNNTEEAVGGFSVNSGNSLTIYAQSTGDEMGELIASAYNRYAGIGGDNGVDCGKVTINGGNIIASSKNRAAAIGGGLDGSGGDITINDGYVSASAGSNYEPAAIGGGGSSGSAGTIVIRGGHITATGGNRGIGAGGGTSTGSITITGGVIAANGVGVSTSGSSNVSTTVSGNAIITLTNNSKINTTNSLTWNGIIIENGVATVYGDVTLIEDLIVSEGNSLVVSENSTLIIPDDLKIVNNGTITVKDGANLDGPIEGNGTLYSALRGRLSILGNAVYGETLTASYALGYPTETFTYQWYRDGVTLEGATTDTYELGLDDIGKVISVTITGTGDFNGTKSKRTPEVKKREFSENEITVIGYNSVFDGEEHGIEITAPDDATVLFGTQEGSYSLPSSPTFSAIGNHIVYYQITKPGYETVGSAVVNIEALSIEDATVTLSDTTYTFTGSEFKPTVTVTLGENELTLNEDYSITWPTDVVKPSEKEIVIKGIGNYKDEIKKSYNIIRANHTVANFDFSADTYTYDGTEKSATVNLKSGIADDIDFTVNYYNSNGDKLPSKPIDAGTYTVKIDVEQSDCYNEVNELYNYDWKLVIQQRSVTVKANDLTRNYDEVDQQLTYSIISGSLANGETLAGSLIRESGNDIGDYRILQGTIDSNNNPNYGIEFIEGKFTILPIAANIGEVTATIPENTNDIRDVILQRTDTSIAGNLTVKADQSLEVGQNTIEWIFNPSSNNYSAIGGTVNVTVVDTIAPTGTVTIGENSWTSFVNTVTFGLFFKETQMVTVSSQDNLSGVEKVEYFESSQGLTVESLDALSDNSWTDMTDSGVNITVEDAKQFVYYIRLTDAVGNQSYISTNGAEYDTLAPAFNGINNSATYYTTQKVEVIERNLDTLTLNNRAADNPVILNGDKEASYTIVATDKIDNSASISVTMKPINSLTTDIDAIENQNVTENNESTINSVKNNIDAIDTTTATTAEIEKINAIKSKIDGLLAVINSVRNDILSIRTSVQGYHVNTIKSSEKADLEQAKTDIEALLDSDNLTASQIEQINMIDSSVDNLINKIAEVVAENNRITDKYNDYDLSSVKSSDSDDLTQLLNDIITQSNSTNITSDENAQLLVQKAGCELLLSKIEAVADTMNSYKNSVDNYDEDNLTYNDKEALMNIIEGIEVLVESDNLTQAENDAILEVKADAEALVKIIDSAERVRITNALNGYTLNSVKSSDSVDLLLLLEDIKEQLDTINLTPDEVNALNVQKEFVEALLVRIKDVGDILDSISDRIANYSSETVKTSDFEDIKELVEDIEEFSYQDNITEDEELTLTAQKQNTDELYDKIKGLIDELEDITEKVDAYDLSTVKDSDKDDVTELLGRITQQLEINNYSDDDISKLNRYKTTCENILAKLQGIKGLIENLKKQIDAYDITSIKATDKESIEDIVTNVGALLKSDNLLDTQIEQLNKINETATSLIKMIKKVEALLATDNIKKVNGITTNNVKLTDKTDLENAVIDFELALQNNKSNYTAAQVNSINAEITRMKSAIDAIDEVYAVEELINSIPSVVKISDADLVLSVQEAYDALSENQKSLISDELKAKLDAAVEKLSGIMIAYGDKSKGNVKKDKTTDGDDSPDTGDKSRPFVWGVLFIISGLYLGVIIFGINRKKNNKNI